MMADLVHENVRDDIPKRFIAVGPVIEQGTAIEEHHVRLLRQITEASLIQTYSVVKTHEIEGAVDAELLKHLVRRELFHPHDDVAAHLAEMRGQRLPGFRSQLLNVFKAGRADIAPLGAIGHCHHWI